MATNEMRQRLAIQQAALLKALTGGAAPPAGFDLARLTLAGHALARKRSRNVTKAWPALARALGEDFDVHFAEFAAANPLPELGGPLADGRAFARFLALARELPEEATLEALAVDLSHASTTRGLRPRRGFAVRVAWLRRDGRLVLGVRMPGFGVRWLSMATKKIKV